MKHHPNRLVMIPMIAGLLTVGISFFAGSVMWMLLGIFLYIVGSYVATTYSFDLIAKQIAGLERQIDDFTLGRSQ